MSKLLTIEQLAERWSTSVRHVRELRYRREITAIKIGGSLRFPLDGVEAFEAAHTEQAAS